MGRLRLGHQREALLDVEVEASNIVIRVGQKIWTRIQKWWHKYGPAGSDRLINVWCKNIEVRMDQEDGGEIGVYLHLQNLTRRRIEAIDLHVSTVRISGGALKEVRPDVSGTKGAEVGPRKTEYLYFKIPIGRRDMSSIASWLDEATNAYSTPRNKIDIRGFLRLKVGLRERKVQFFLKNEAPEYHMPYLS